MRPGHEDKRLWRVLDHIGYVTQIKITIQKYNNTFLESQPILYVTKVQCNSENK